MYKFKFLAMIVLATLFGACKDDSFGIADYSENEPATIKLEIKVPKSKKIINSRAVDANAESEITQLAMFGYEKSSGRAIAFDLTGKLTSNGDANDKAGRTYTLTEDQETKSGHYRLYVVANWSSAFGGMTFSELETMAQNEEDLKKALYANENGVCDLSGANGFPMSAYYEEFVINAGDNHLTGERAIALDRTTSLIEFKFVNGKLNGSNIETQFTPISYSIYNVPKTASVFSNYDPETIETFNIKGQTVVGDGEFSFFMLENDQTGKQLNDVTEWKDREVWDFDGQTSVPFDVRKFTNAPAQGTFVVVEGNYSGPASKEAPDELFTGNVRFIIHLGNFGSSTGGGNYNNYNVNRNENHIYTITVNSATSILANVNVTDGKNPAFEGSVYNNNDVYLDSHYGKVMVRILKKSLSDNPTAVVCTAKNGWNQTTRPIAELTDADDYKWIQFQKPESADKFPVYAGIDADGNCLNANNSKWGYLTDLVANPTEYCYDDGGEYYYTAAFVDENVYTGNNAMASMDSWAGASKRSRQMILNPQNPTTSDDEQSIIGGPASFIISQWPIITSYNLKGMDPQTTNPFGFENIAEDTNCPTALTNPNFKGALQWDNYNTVPTLVLNNDTNGQYNTTRSFSDISVVDAFWSVKADGKYHFNAGNINVVSEALSTRNRDFNGNGKIDDDEIRWYVPTLTEMLIIWFTRDGIPDSHKLFDKNLCNSTENLDTYYPRYMTSSYSGGDQMKRIYWYDQGATGAQWQLNAGWFSSWQMVRFCRNLGAADDAYKSDITRLTSNDADKRVISINALATTIRQTPQSGPYPAHNLFEDYNRVPRQLEYGDSLLTIYRNPSSSDAGTWGPFWGNNFGNGTTDIQTQVDNLNKAVIKAYNIQHSTDLTELPDGWRVPNQREMQMLIINGLIEKYLNLTMPTNNTTTSVNPFLSAGLMMSCTFPYGTGYASKQWPLVWNDGALVLNNMGSSGVHRCFVILVRDYEDTTATAKAGKKSARKR